MNIQIGGVAWEAITSQNLRMFGVVGLGCPHAAFIIGLQAQTRGVNSNQPSGHVGSSEWGRNGSAFPGALFDFKGGNTE